MILNTHTVILLFIAVLTGTLAAALAFFSGRILYRTSLALTVEERTDTENSSYLLLYIATVLLWIKLLSWPLFYVALQSFIPYIQGAMCIFGVTQAQPYFSGSSQIIKPVVFFLIGGWLLLNGLDRRTETSPLFRRKIAFLVFLSIIVAADSIQDLVYLTSFETASDVSCCTTFFDLPERTTAAVSISLLGSDYEKYILPAYLASNIGLIALTAAAYFYVSGPKVSHRARLLFLVPESLFALFNAAVTVIAMFEVIAPVVMELPLHHCIYCMWQYVPGTIFLTAGFILGTFFVCWALFLYLSGRSRETGSVLLDWIRNLHFLAAAFLGVSLIMTIGYLILRDGLHFH